MDVRCAKCGEPWDTHHLLWEAVHETDLPEKVKEDWLPARDAGKPSVKAAFARAGYVYFGGNILALRRCPCCASTEEPAKKTFREEAYEALSNVLGDDLDGFAAEAADLDELIEEGDL